MLRALKPLLLILGMIAALALAAYLYEQKWGLDGPFPTQHHHDGEPAGVHDHGHP